MVRAAIVTESTLTFLGFGIQAPKTSRGLMLSDNETAINDTAKMHLLLFPGMMLLVVDGLTLDVEPLPASTSHGDSA